MQQYNKLNYNKYMSTYILLMNKDTSTSSMETKILRINCDSKLAIF